MLGSRCFSGPDKWKIRSSCRSHDQKVSNLLSSVFVRKSIGCGFADFVCIFLKNPPNNRRSFSSALKCRFYHSFHTSYTCDAVWYKKENTIKYNNAQFHGISSTFILGGSLLWAGEKKSEKIVILFRNILYLPFCETATCHKMCETVGKTLHQ